MKKIITLMLYILCSSAFADDADNFSYMIVNNVTGTIVLEGDNGVCSTSTSIGSFKSIGGTKGFRRKDIAKLCAMNEPLCTIDIELSDTCDRSKKIGQIYLMGNGIARNVAVAEMTNVYRIDRRVADPQPIFGFDVITVSYINPPTN